MLKKVKSMSSARSDYFILSSELLCKWEVHTHVPHSSKEYEVQALGSIH